MPEERTAQARWGRNQRLRNQNVHTQYVDIVIRTRYPKESDLLLGPPQDFATIRM